MFLHHTINTLTSNLDRIQAITLRGSQQVKEQVDLWSDHDLLVVLQPGVQVNEGEFVHAVHKIGRVVRSEIYSGDDSVLYRTAIEFESSVELLDATVCSHDAWLHTEAPELQTVVFGQMEIVDATTSKQSTYEAVKLRESQSNPIWFKYFVAVKKFCRNDNLIGMHLLLDLVREYLVLQMIVRDNLHKTNIHRFGGNERLPESIRLSLINESDRDEILDYIAKLACEYDHKLASMTVNYESRYHAVLEYIERSKRHLRSNCELPGEDSD